MINFKDQAKEQEDRRSLHVGMKFGLETEGDFRNQKTTTSGTTSGKTHVAMIIPRGEVIRNFVYSNCLDHIAADSRLSLISVSSSSDTDTLLRENYGSLYTLNEVDESWIVRFQRDILDIAHGRRLWSRAAQRRWEIRDMEADSPGKRIKRITKKAVSRPFANKFGLQILSVSERVSSRVLNSSNLYKNLYMDIQPSVVFNGSHIHSRNAIQAVQAAQWLGIPTATFIFSWDNLTSQGRIILPYDYFLVWNETLKQQLLEMYDWIDPANVFVTGTPQFDMHFWESNYMSRENYCAQIGADPDRPLVLYTTGMANHMPSEPEIVEGIADMLAAYPAKTRPQLLVRVYAKDLTERFDDLRKSRPEILFADPIWEPEWLTPKPEDSVALVNALRHSALGINVASTVSLELCMFDKPVINVGYNPASLPLDELSYADYYEFDHYKPVVESRAVQVASDTEQMGELIRESLSTPEKYRHQRKELIGQMFGSTLDGESGLRVAETLLRIARTGN